MNHLPRTPEPGAKVFLWSDIDSRHTRSGAWARTWGEDFAGPHLSHVLICQMPEDERVHLLGYDERSNLVHDSDHASIQEAKEYAERESPELSVTWAGAPA